MAPNPTTPITISVTSHPSSEPSEITEHIVQSNPSFLAAEESINQYSSQGNAYVFAAIEHANEGHQNLAAHLAEEANKKYSLAEDAQLAVELQEQEYVKSSSLQDLK